MIRQLPRREAPASKEEAQLRRLRPPLIAIWILIACSPYNGVNEYHQLAVVNAVLVSGQSGQSLTVMWSGTPQRGYPPDGPSASDVNLWITSTAGDSVAVVPTDSSGVYTIALTPHPGVTYRLNGTILGASVTGATTVPTLIISAPGPGDTLKASRLPRHFFPQLPLVLVTAGVGGYALVSDQILEGNEDSNFLFNTSYLSNFKEPLYLPTYIGQAALPVHADIVAYDVNAAAFYGVVQVDQPGTPMLGGRISSTITGALGLFGSSSSAAIDVVIVP